MTTEEIETLNTHLTTTSRTWVNLLTLHFGSSVIIDDRVKILIDVIGSPFRASMSLRLLVDGAVISGWDGDNRYQETNIVKVDGSQYHTAELQWRTHGPVIEILVGNAVMKVGQFNE